MGKYVLIKVDECGEGDGDACFVMMKDHKTIAYGEGRNPIGLAKDILDGWVVEGVGLVVDGIDCIVAITKEP